MVVAMDRDGSTSSVCGHSYWRLGSAAMKNDAGANWVAAAQGADGYRCGRNNGSAGATAAVNRARSWCARGRCRWQWRLG